VKHLTIAGGGILAGKIPFLTPNQVLKQIEFYDSDDKITVCFWWLRFLAILVNNN